MVLDSNAKDLLEIHKFCVETLKADTHAFQFLKGSPHQHSDTMIDLEKIFDQSSAEVYENEQVIWDQLENIRKYDRDNGCRSFVHPKVADLTAPEKSNQKIP